MLSPPIGWAWLVEWARAPGRAAAERHGAAAGRPRPRVGEGAAPRPRRARDAHVDRVPVRFPARVSARAHAVSSASLTPRDERRPIPSVATRGTEAADQAARMSDVAGIWREG